MVLLPKIVIVEGIDRVGKTTFVNIMQNKYGYNLVSSKFNDTSYRNSVDIIKGKFLPEILETEKIWSVISVLKAIPPNSKIIIDRFHLSEYVYGKCDRNYINSSWEQIDQALYELGSLLVYIKPTDIKWSSIKHGEDLSRHLYVFDQLLKITKLQTLTADHNTLEVIIDEFENTK